MATAIILSIGRAFIPTLVLVPFRLELLFVPFQSRNLGLKIVNSFVCFRKSLTCLFVASRPRHAGRINSVWMITDADFLRRLDADTAGQQDG